MVQVGTRSVSESKFWLNLGDPAFKSNSLIVASGEVFNHVVELPNGPELDESLRDDAIANLGLTNGQILERPLAYYISLFGSQQIGLQARITITMGFLGETATPHFDFPDWLDPDFQHKSLELLPSDAEYGVIAFLSLFPTQLFDPKRIYPDFYQTQGEQYKLSGVLPFNFYGALRRLGLHAAKSTPGRPKNVPHLRVLISAKSFGVTQG